MPVWALPNAPDMTKWQWQPPKPPSFWPQLPQVEDVADADAETDFLLPEPVAELQPLVQPEDPAELGLQDSAAIEEEIVLQTLAETSPSLGLQLQALFNDTFPTAQDFIGRYEAFAKAFQKEISNGRLRGPQIFDVYDLARRALVRALPRVKRPPLMPLLSAVIEGMKAADELYPHFLRSFPQHWVILIKHLARQDPSVRAAQLFALLLESMPPIRRNRTRGAIMNVLSSYFKIWQALSIHGTPTQGSETEAAQTLQLAFLWAGRGDANMVGVKSHLAQNNLDYAKFDLYVAKKCHARAWRFLSKTSHLLSDDKVLIGFLAKALQTHDSRIHRSLFSIATKLSDTHAGKWTRLRYNWLHILARLPHIQQSRFKSILELFPKRGIGALSQAELGDLLLRHWETIGMLKNPRDTRRIWQKLRGANDSTIMAALAFAINFTHDPKQCTALLWSFWDFMHLRVGEKTIVKQMLSLSKTQAPSSPFLQRMAWTSREYDTALMLHDILVKQKGKDPNFWGPAFWDKYVKQHRNRMKYSFISPAVLVEKLLDEPHGAGEKSDLQDRQRMRIRESIKMIAGNRHLTERERFRYTAVFTKHLAGVQGFLTPQDLSALTDVVTEALKRGEGGSTERLRWYLGVVLTHLGQEACSQVGMILKRRREWNGRQWADGVEPEGRVVEQQTDESALRRQPYEGPHQGATWPLWRYHLTKNRRKAKMLRHREKAGVRMPVKRLRKTPDGRIHSKAKASHLRDADAFSALREGASPQEFDPRASF
ncbi:hypothetical protein Daus18300_005804 [Diaporthe australafricana]|uniref:Uncharacterized protein n=1 Tax=Diaporthe australafricana TaxID=127596 RepID=A0ABR3WYU9_9PEZI